MLLMLQVQTKRPGDTMYRYSIRHDNEAAQSAIFLLSGGCSAARLLLPLKLFTLA